MRWILKKVNERIFSNSKYSNFKEAKALILIIQQLSLTNIKNISACPEVGTDFLKGQCHKIFFNELVSPKPLSIPKGPFHFFLFSEIFTSEGVPRVSLNSVANGKIFTQKSLNMSRCIVIFNVRVCGQ